MDLSAIWTVIFLLLVALGTLLWGVYVAYRTGRLGGRYAKQQKTDLEQVLNLPSTPIKSSFNLPPSTFSFMLKARDILAQWHSTPPGTPLSPLAMRMFTLSSPTSLHVHPRSRSMTLPTPPESPLSAVIYRINPRILAEENRLRNEGRMDWFVKTGDDSNQGSVRETLEKDAAVSMISSHRVTSLIGNSSVIKQRAPLTGLEMLAHPNSETAPVRFSALSIPCSKSAHHRRSWTIPRLTFTPSTAHNSLLLNSDVLSSPELSTSPTSPHSEVSESPQSHAGGHAIWTHPHESIACEDASDLSLESQLQSQSSQQLLEHFPAPPSHLLHYGAAIFMANDKSDANSDDSKSVKAFTLLTTLPSSPHGATVPMPPPCFCEAKNLCFPKVQVEELPHYNEMLARRRPLSMLHDDLKSISWGGAQTNSSVPRANTDPCLLMVG